MVTYPLPDQKGRAIAWFWVRPTAIRVLFHYLCFVDCIQLGRRDWFLHLVCDQLP